jgi:hypothetical protein
MKTNMAPFIVKRHQSDDLTLEILIGYLDEWLGGCSPKHIPLKLADKPEDIVFEYDALMAKTLDTLKKICKENKLTQNGTKATLVKRILDSKKVVEKECFGSDSEDEKVVRKPKGKAKTPVKRDDSDEEKVAKRKKTVAKKKPVKEEKLFELADVEIKKDEYGNLYNKDTGFVFNTSDEVIGYKDSDGNVRELTNAHMDKCKEMGFIYIVPMSNPSDEDEE